MMDENHPKRGHMEYTKARATLLGVLVICVLIEILIFVIGGSIFVHCTNKKARQSEKIVKSYAENELKYYDTVEWFISAQNIAQVLNISESKGDKVLNHIHEIYQEQFKHDIYAVTRFEQIDDTNHYIVVDSDSYAKIEVEVTGTDVVFVQELSF